ncbi:MAG: exopolysaccharide biosynthesis protein [Alphaproteobacteria bacterium]|nr:MAG: exopolysaccharide biosynthesis protein [Alphaproteobacteria bacterium]
MDVRHELAARRAPETLSSPFLQCQTTQHGGVETLAAGSLTPVGGAAKRGFDVCVSATLLLAGLPFLIFIWLLVRLSSRGPGLYFQQRGGFAGKSFRIVKFRTLSRCDQREVTQVVTDDIRVTSLGKFLRRTSLDELPQFYNVLVGDMSLIGPRPHALQHDQAFAEIDARYVERFAARPGITGLAQVQGSRGPTNTEEKIWQRTKLDVQYVRHWTLLVDARIVFRTALLLVRGDRNAF